MEVNQSGDIVWQVPSTLPYEAERLKTGDKSTGGQSAAALGLESRTAAESDGSDDRDGFGFNPLEFLGDIIKLILPHRIYNALLFISPVWIGQSEFADIGIALLTGLFWTGLEIRWQLKTPESTFGFLSPVRATTN